MSRKRPPNRHTLEAFTPEQTAEFLAGEWVVFISDWPQAARWLAGSATLEVRFRNGHVEPYPVGRFLALSFAAAPSKGGWLWDHFLQHKRKH